MTLITAAEAKALATPAFPKRVENFIEETHKAICEAANGGLKNIILRVPTDVAEEVLKILREAGYQIIPRQEPREGMSFFQIGWN